MTKLNFRKASVLFNCGRFENTLTLLLFNQTRILLHIKIFLRFVIGVHYLLLDTVVDMGYSYGYIIHIKYLDCLSAFICNYSLNTFCIYFHFFNAFFLKKL